MWKFTQEQNAKHVRIYYNLFLLEMICGALILALLLKATDAGNFQKRALSMHLLCILSIVLECTFLHLKSTKAFFVVEYSLIF